MAAAVAVSVIAHAQRKEPAATPKVFITHEIMLLEQKRLQDNVFTASSNVELSGTVSVHCISDILTVAQCRTRPDPSGLHNQEIS